jgi:phenylalanyl-tRNA synthetase beta chain
MTVTKEQAANYLDRLGFDVEGLNAGDELTVISPSWRPDIVREEDLVEELGRVHGYDRIPESLPSGLTTQGGSQGEYLVMDRLREAAVRTGFIQMVSHSLRDFNALDRPIATGSGIERIGPRVVASPEHAILRDSLLPSLMDAAIRNGGRNLHLFEMGQAFWKGQGTYIERRMMAFLSGGELLPSDRKGRDSRQADFFSLKGVVEAVSASVGITIALANGSADPRLHPTRQASIIAAGRTIGGIGQIHPDIAEALKAPPGVFLAEFDVYDLISAGTPGLAIRPISRNPSVRRDIAVLVEKSIAFDRIESAIARACGEVLERQWLFDVFEGAGIPPGKHSLGIALQFRKVGENFTDEEANQVRDLAVAALVEFGATMR